MFVLDTNVLSELRKAKAGKADRNVTVWAASVPASALFVSAVTILELETGVLLVLRRDPQQGALLRAWLDQHVLPAFSGRVLPVDTARCAMRLTTKSEYSASTPVVRHRPDSGIARASAPVASRRRRCRPRACDRAFNRSSPPKPSPPAPTSSTRRR